MNTVLRQAQDERGFVDRLTRKARAFGLARAEALLLERSDNPARRWRKAWLLWPLFAKDIGSTE